MTSFHEQRDVVLAVTGASGAAIGLAVLDLLCWLGVRVHLVVTQSGKRTLLHEAGADAHDGMLPKAYRSYDNGDIGATIASGSFPVAGMIVAPCSFAFITQRKPTGCASAIEEPWIHTQSACWRSCRSEVAPPRPNEAPRPGTVEECHMRAWFSICTAPMAEKNFLIR